MRSFSHYGTRIATVDAVVLVGDVQTRDRANVHSSLYGVATVQRLIAVVLVGDVQMLHQNHNRRLLWASLVYMRQAISFVVGLAA